jgi:hypothetical protein
MDQLFVVEEFLLANPEIALLIALWSLVWTGWALWRAARRSQKNWFIVMLLLNTLGILEILYIFFFSKKKEESLVLVKKSEKADLS